MLQLERRRPDIETDDANIGKLLGYWWCPRRYAYAACRQLLREASSWRRP